MKSREFDNVLNEKVRYIENIIEKYLPQEVGFQKTVLTAMNYSIKAGGKRLRPMFMLETYKLFGGDGEIVEPFMAAMEMIHTYSLVHDDLPAMDNDEYRRGKKTTWVMFGEAMAILTGDALLNFAFETAIGAFDKSNDIKDITNIARALKVLSTKAGIYGMVGGQVIDVEAEKKSQSLSEEQILCVHENKTAALIQSSLMIGAILAGASELDVNVLEKIGYNVGIAFQIQDDILDVIGDSEILGKNVGSDALNDKQTYVTINGIDKSKEEVKRLSDESICLLKKLPGEHEFLEELIKSLINRVK